MRRILHKVKISVRGERCASGGILSPFSLGVKAANLISARSIRAIWVESIFISGKSVYAKATMLNLPNILTLSRIFAVPILVFLLWPNFDRTALQPLPIDYLLAFALYCLMAVTDYFDGYLARTQGTVSKLGIFLDPIADKIMVAAVVLMLIFTRDIHGWHTIAAIVILLREIMVSGLREFLAGLQVSVPVSQLAKWKTGFQMISLGALILAGGLPHFAVVETVGLWTLWAAALLTLITGWDYLRVGLKHMD
jgi:CDP-diacylglycerol---glycerol-3-phosphate 3-phosphatidyltransferase